MKRSQVKQAISEAIERFGVMQIGGERNEVDFKKVSEWLDRNYPENKEAEYTKEDMKEAYWANYRVWASFDDWLASYHDDKEETKANQSI